MSTDTTVLTAAEPRLGPTWAGWPRPAPRPAEALDRIRQLCELAGDDLHRAMLLVLATHQAVPREILASALKQFRRDPTPDPRGRDRPAQRPVDRGQQGFQSVLRTRKGGERKPANLGWLKTDD
jgi:hypothetical protein